MFQGSNSEYNRAQCQGGLLSGLWQHENSTELKRLSQLSDAYHYGGQAQMGYYNNTSESYTVYGKDVTETTDLEGKYILWQPKATTPPTKYFDDRPTAIKAAYAMAGKNLGKGFAVCKVIGVAKTQDVKFVSFEE